MDSPACDVANGTWDVTNGLCDVTNGACDVTIGPAMSLMGFLMPLMGLVMSLMGLAMAGPNPMPPVKSGSVKIAAAQRYQPGEIRRRREIGGFLAV